MYISEFIPPLWFQRGYFQSKLQTSMNQSSWYWVWTTTRLSIMTIHFSTERNKAVSRQSRMVRTLYRRTQFFSIRFYYGLYHLFSWSFFLRASNLLMQCNCSSEIIVANGIPVADVKSIFISIKCSAPLIKSPRPKSYKKILILVPQLCQMKTMCQPSCSCFLKWSVLGCLHESDLIFKGSEEDLKKPYSLGSWWKISFLV